MNDTAMIFALALASNQNPQRHLHYAFEQLKQLGVLNISPTFLIPCRDHIGQDYWNAACLVRSKQSVNQVKQFIKGLEAASGRVRPSHQISLDVDLIAWGEQLTEMQFNPKKMPLADDVKIPLYEIWQHPQFKCVHDFPVISTSQGLKEKT